MLQCEHIHSYGYIFVMSRNILCVGGCGALGRQVLNMLSSHSIVNVDFSSHPSATHNVLLHSDQSPQHNNKHAIQTIKQLNTTFDAMVVTAGGWTGGSIADNDYLEKVRQMSRVNLHPCLLTAHLATQLLKPKGLVVFTGAAAVYQEPQPEMIAYALAKTGVHSLATSLAGRLTSSESRVVTMLPEVIDTPANREGMPKSDFSKWASPQRIGELVRGWVQGLNVPPNGSFVLLKVKQGCVMPELL